MNDSITVSGLGFDAHALKKSSPGSIILCAHPIACEYGVIAHSDGDVALHALADAMLGAIAAGDIGEHFSPTDDRWKDAASTLFIEHILRLYEFKNAALVNIDLTIICEEPKISPHKTVMKKNLSRITQLPLERINVKATTTEQLGFLGRKEGVAAQAIVTVKLPS